MPDKEFSKPIDVICPVDDSAICEFSFDVNISNTLDAHMTLKHPDWRKMYTLSYFPRTGGLPCPYCNLVYNREDYFQRHIDSKHPDRERASNDNAEG